MLRGVSHVHTTYSFDGKLSPTELRDFFGSRGFQFILLSEHVESLDVTRINSLIEECRRLSTPHCTLIPGVEIDDLNILAFGITEARDYAAVDELVGVCLAQGALLVYAHPVKHHRLPAHVVELCHGVEVCNTRYDGKLRPRQSTLDIYRQMLARNPGLLPFCGIDFHKVSDFASAYIALDAPSVDPAAILRVLKSGQYQLYLNDRQLEVQPAHSVWKRWSARSMNTLYTRLYDLAVMQNRWLQKHRVPVPQMLKTAMKRYF